MNAIGVMINEWNLSYLSVTWVSWYRLGTENMNRTTIFNNFRRLSLEIWFK